MGRLVITMMLQTMMSLQITADGCYCFVTFIFDRAAIEWTVKCFCLFDLWPTVGQAGFRWKGGGANGQLIGKKRL